MISGETCRPRWRASSARVWEAALLALLLLLSACGDDAPAARCPETPCPAGMTCQQGECVAGLSCSTDEDCLNDSFCQQGWCVAYGAATKQSDPGCARLRLTPGRLESPRLKCSWDVEGVETTPLVVDLEGDGAAEIVFVSESGALVILSGDSCEQLLFTASELTSENQLAAGDLDGDGLLEIVGVDLGQHVLVYDRQGQLIARSPDNAEIYYTSRFYGGPALAELDGAPPAEIVYGGMALRLEGGALSQLYNVKVNGAERGHLAVLSDLDGDGLPELISGNSIRDGASGEDETPPGVAQLSPGFAAVADLDGLPGPEVVLLSSRESQAPELRIYKPDSGAVIFGPYSFGNFAGGPPTVADFDGDGAPEIGVAADDSYVVFDPECAADPRPAACQGPGVRWQKPIRDLSSGSTGSSVFDFDGDGAAEVVYRDECWLRIYAGVDGTLLAAQPVTSGTWVELPVVADVDGDGHAELLTVADDSVFDCEAEPELGLPAGPRLQGLLVFEGEQDGWAPARPLWNQHTYHITNVADDGTLPFPEQPSWEIWNSFRQNSGSLLPPTEPAPDLTARAPDEASEGAACQTGGLYRARVCNRGAAPVAAGVGGAFYRGDPAAGGELLCRASTAGELPPGSCEVVSCSDAGAAAASEPLELWYFPDDPEAGAAVTECKERNSAMHLPQAVCAPSMQ